MRSLFYGAGLLCLLPCLAGPGYTVAATLDGLLAKARLEATASRQVDKEREARFLAERGQQAAKLEQARRELAQLEAANQALRARYDTNREGIAELGRTLAEHSRDLQQVYSSARLAARELDAVLADSLVSAQRWATAGEGDGGSPAAAASALAPLLDSASLPRFEDLTRLWTSMLEEMVESGKVVRFGGRVIAPDGSSRDAEIVRVGAFDLIADGEFLRYRDGRLYVLPRQPRAELVRIAAAYTRAHNGLADAVIDPSRGPWLELLTRTPSLRQRLRQGGPIGYSIMALGAGGLVLGLWRLVGILVVSRRTQRQLQQPQAPRSDNPLGRVLQAYGEGRASDPAHLELRLQEAALREVPRLTRAIGFLKLLAAVAPLLGLLGTVTGMILTFQAITLSAAGTTQLMAEGIGQALVTTVLGLLVAIPLLFLHNLLASRSRALIQMLDEETAGLIAQALTEGEGGA